MALPPMPSAIISGRGRAAYLFETKYIPRYLAARADIFRKARECRKRLLETRDPTSDLEAVPAVQQPASSSSASALRTVTRESDSVWAITFHPAE